MVDDGSSGRRCSGKCGRLLPASAFPANGAWRRTRCSACRRLERGSVVRDYERALADFRARRIGWDDPRFADARGKVRAHVLGRGPISADGVRLGWDHVRDDVSRRASKGGRS